MSAPVFWAVLHVTNGARFQICFVLKACLYSALEIGRYTCDQCKAANKGKSPDDPTRCTTSFNAWDAGVLAKMDDFVSNEFPFIVTHQNAISKTLVNRLADDLVAGKGFSATSNFIRQAYMTTYMKSHRSYVSLANRRRRQRAVLFGSDDADVPRFGEFGDRLGFNSSCPSEHYLRDIWHKWFSEIPVVRVRRACHDLPVSLLSTDDFCYSIATLECDERNIRLHSNKQRLCNFCSATLECSTCQDEDRVWTREEYLQRRAQLVDGHLFAGDASFKYAKVIRLSTGPDGKRARPVYGIFTIMNEYDQVG